MLFDDNYRSIDKVSKGLYKEKGSKFISLAIPVMSETEVNDQLKVVRKEYYDANHHCYAYRLGFDKMTYRHSDDREPSGTAGRPIFGQIQSFDLTNVLVVVIRYFGGTKLGVSGLINAYREAAREALLDAQIIEKSVYEIYTLEYEYESVNEVMRIMKICDVKQIEGTYSDRCQLKISVRKNEALRFIEEIKKVKNLSYRYLQNR